MPSDIGARMSVSGVASFKSAMSQGKSAVKALDAELKLSAAQYKASGDAEQYMADRSRILSQQIRAQEDVVANAQKALEQMASQGVDKASTAYTQMQATLARARTDLVNMQTAAGQAGTELSEAADSGQKMADSLGSIDKTGKLNTLTSVISRIDDMLTGMLTKVVNIGKGIWDWGRAGSEWADDLATNATIAGMDVETYQRWSYAANLVDTSVDDIVKATDRLTKATKGAEDGIAVIETETGQWGINLKDTSGAMRSQMDVFWDFVDILQSVENETERNALAQDYFGKSYRELLPLINAGRDAWEQAAGEADIVSADDVSNLTAFNDALQELDQKWQSTTMTVLAELAPSFERISDALGRVLDRISEWAQSDEGQEALASIGDSVATLIENLADGDFFAKMFQGAVDAVSKIADFLETLTGDDIIHGLEVIAGIIAGIKLASGTIRGLELIHSLGLFSGKGAGAAGAAGAGGGTGLGIGGLLLRGAEGAGTGALTYNIGTVVLNQSEEEAGAWATAAGIATMINPKLGAAVFGVQQLVGGHTANDEAAIATLGKTGSGKELHINAQGVVFEGTGGPDELYQFNAEALARMGVSPESALMPSDIVDYLRGNFLPESMMYGAFSDWSGPGGAVVALDEAGNFYYNYFEDLNAEIDRINGAMTGTGEIAEGISSSEGEVKDAASDLGAQIPEGALEQVSAAFGAGVALASAFAAGASSVGAPGGGSSSTYNSSYVNSVNFFGAMTAQEVTQAYRSYTQTQQAGYGG